MRNPFARLASRSPEKPTLRERLAATKEKYGRTPRVHRALNPPAPEPAADRVALVNYATWLSFERVRVCSELYPHMGVKASQFVLTSNAAERFFYPDGINNGRTGAWKNVPPASSRAVKVLDLVGVDWRTDVARGHDPDLGASELRDNGKRPVVPYGWPAPDAALLTGLSDLHRIEAARSTMTAGLGDRDCDDVPGFDTLGDVWDETFERFCKAEATTLAGLQAKAKGLLLDGVDVDYARMETLARSIGRDLRGATNRTIEPQPDPILAAIAETRRLAAARTAAADLPRPDDAIDLLPEYEAAGDAFYAHVDTVLMKTVPTTAAGCTALARYAVEFLKDEGFALDEDQTNEAHVRILDLIARSPLL